MRDRVSGGQSTMRSFFLEGIEALAQRAWRKESMFLNSHGPQVPLNFPDISLAFSLHSVRKEEETVWKKHRSSATLLMSHTEIWQRGNLEERFHQFSRKLNPTCSFQCRKWDRELSCWKILNFLLIYLHFLRESRLSIQPVHSLRATRTVDFFKNQRKDFKAWFIQIAWLPLDTEKTVLF